MITFAAVASLTGLTPLCIQLLTISKKPHAQQSQGGKSIPARHLTSMLPSMTLGEANEITRMPSVAVLTEGRTALPTLWPLPTVYHLIYDASLREGGQVLMRREVSRAHRGILFLNELQELRWDILELLRQQLEKSIARI